MAAALLDTTNGHPVASNGGSEGSTRVTRRGSVGFGRQDGRKLLAGGGLLKGADQTAMAAELGAAAVAVKAALKREKISHRLVASWPVCSQLRETIKHGRANGKTFE